MRISARPPERIEIAVYYVVAEALTNVAKHAQASHAVVEVDEVDGVIRVSVSDDGIRWSRLVPRLRSSRPAGSSRRARRDDVGDQPVLGDHPRRRAPHDKLGSVPSPLSSLRSATSVSRGAQYVSSAEHVTSNLRTYSADPPLTPPDDHVGFPPVMSVAACNCLRHARGLRPLLPGRAVQGRPVRRLVLHRGPHHEDLLRPSCPVVRPRTENMRFYPSAAAAQQAGFRACKRCRPDAAPGSPQWNERADVVARAMRLIAEAPSTARACRPGRRLGYSTRQFERHCSPSSAPDRSRWPGRSERRPPGC